MLVAYVLDSVVDIG